MKKTLRIMLMNNALIALPSSVGIALLCNTTIDVLRLCFAFKRLWCLFLPFPRSSIETLCYLLFFKLNFAKHHFSAIDADNHDAAFVSLHCKELLNGMSTALARREMLSLTGFDNFDI